MDKYIFEGINKYCSTLSQLGYIPLIEMKRILVASFLSELLTECFDKLVNDEEEHKLVNMIKKISRHSCLISCIYDYQHAYDNVISSKYPRVTENGLTLRINDDGLKALN